MRRCGLCLLVLLLLVAGCKPLGSNNSQEGVTQTVGASGGIVRFPGGTLSVPPGAVDQPIKLRVDNGGELPATSPLVGSWHPLGTGLRVDLGGRQPAVPLELAMDTGLAAGVDAERLFV